MNGETSSSDKAWVEAVEELEKENDWIMVPQNKEDCRPETPPGKRVPIREGAERIEMSPADQEAAKDAQAVEDDVD